MVRQLEVRRTECKEVGQYERECAWNREVGGGTGSDRSSQRQDTGVTHARGPDTSRDIKIIPWRNPWKTKEDGGKQEANAGGRDKSDVKEARRQVQQRHSRGKIAMEDLDKVREQAGRPRSEVRTG